VNEAVVHEGHFRILSTTIPDVDIDRSVITLNYPECEGIHKQDTVLPYLVCLLPPLWSVFRASKVFPAFGTAKPSHAFTVSKDASRLSVWRR